MWDKLLETPEGMALIVWIAALAAGYDSGNRDRASAVLDLFTRCKRVVDGEGLCGRRPPH